MKKFTFAAVLVAIIGVAVAAPAYAQDDSKDDESRNWWSWALPAVMDGAAVPTAQGEVVLPRRSGEAEPAARAQGGKARGRAAAGEAPGRDKRRGNGPPFCRDGRGHPVHGTDWCRDKGWDDDGRLWQRASWPDVILGRRERDNDVLDRRTLGDILGEIVLGKVDERSRYLGLDAELVGRLVRQPDGSSVLQMRAGDVPVAELSDVDGDGRVDGTLLLEAL
ncbi:MAG: hypothetical protein ABFS34_08930 [Gemmatimonadota bacterium]